MSVAKVKRIARFRLPGQSVIFPGFSLRSFRVLQLKIRQSIALLLKEVFRKGARCWGRERRSRFVLGNDMLISKNRAVGWIHKGKILLLLQWFEKANFPSFEVRSLPIKLVSLLNRQPLKQIPQCKWIGVFIEPSQPAISLWLHALPCEEIRCRA